MNKNFHRYLLTFIVAFAVSFSVGKVLAQQLFENPEAMKAAYQQAAQQGQAALDTLLREAAQKGRPQGENGEKSEYEELFELIDQDKADGQQDGNFTAPGEGGQGQPAAEPQKVTVYDLNEFDIITDGNGNVVEIKKRKKEGEDEEGKDKKDEEGEDQGQGGAGGGGAGAPPAPAGGKFEESKNPKEDYSRWCWSCVQPNQCKNGSPGACDLRPCKEDQNCADHAETTPDGKNIICHVCSPKPPPPPPACEEKGYMSDPKCNGKCPSDLCERIAFGPDGKVRTWTQVRGDLACYRCGEAPQCKVLGYFQAPDCEGNCAPDMCEAVYIKPSGGIYGSGQTISRQDLKCYACKDKYPEPPPECHPGVTDPLCQGMCSPEECEVVDTIDWNGHVWSCYDCEDKKPDACLEKGHFDQPDCNGKCPPTLCAPIDVDKQTGQVVPSMRTRERGSTERCYTCMKIDTIEITYVVIVIETPYARYVLDKAAPGGRFKPSSVMALAQVDPATGMIKDTLGELKQASDFLGSFNAGMGLPGITGQGKVGMGQLTGLLASELKSKGGYKMDCFGDVAKEVNSAPPEEAAQTQDEKKAKKDKKKERGEEGFSEGQLKAADKNGNPAVSGPVVACGEENGNKVLKIYSAGGALVDTVTQQALDLNPNIILEKMGVAQALSDLFIQKSGVDFAGYVEKFTGLPLKQIQSAAAQVADVKAGADELVGKKKKKKAKAEEPPPVLPNDPLYDEGPVKKKKKLLGILGSGASAVSVNSLGVSIKTGRDLAEPSDAEKLDIKDQWGIQQVGFTPWDDPNSAWNVVDAAQKNIVVAVVDSGLDLTHEDAPAYIWKNPKEVPGNGLDDDHNGFIDDIHGWNFLNENHDFTDVRGHGTFVAGIIAAKYNNGVGIAGINPGAVIMPVKVADDEGVTDSLAIYRGINYAVDHGARVINVSLGSKSISRLEQQAVERAQALGALVVVASGNSNENLVSFGPSSSKHALAVGQTDYSGTRSTVSNWGPNLGLLAPGEQIYSLCSKDNKHVLPSIRKAGYYKQDGTSFSTPMVAATASLIWAKNPGLTNRQVTDIILATATDMDDKGWDAATGAGLLNAAAALRADVSGGLMVMITNLRVNRDTRDNVVSVDVYGTARARSSPAGERQLKEFTVETGKGKRAARFIPVAGPYHEEVDYQHIARLNVKEVFRGSDDWVLRLRVVDTQGQEYIASTPFTLPK